ncbi:hypothetical protein KKC_12585, partial [Listeria fleischmannii subsp. coloradonensis]
KGYKFCIDLFFTVSLTYINIEIWNDFKEGRWN